LILLETISHYVSVAYERQRLIDKLRESDRRKDEFLATLAHELRTPLAPLGNMLEILKHSDGNEEILHQVRETLDRQLVQLVRLVDDLLDVGRITRNKLDLQKEIVELAPVIQQAAETCQPLAQSAGVDVNVSLPSTPIFLHADSVRLSQIFSNLLNNACKYTHAGGSVRVSAETQGNAVSVSVKDTGIGIPRDKLVGIFDMFSQIDQSLERSQGGLGIGLTSVKSLVELHGGSIEARSEGPGQGSEFVVSLPIARDGQQRPQPQSSEEVAQGPSRRVLIVDDNPDSAASLGILLKITGHETQIAYDGLEAVAAAERFAPEIVLLDIGLPKLNGYEACRRIRQEPWGREMTLVALTGWGQEGDLNRSREAGFDYHLVKPVDFAKLTKVLAEGKNADV
jgi:CheY-like chemotaxis protein